MRLRLIIGLFAACSPICFVAQATPTSFATVTFYSHGSLLTSGLPGANRDIYYGGVYDGNEELFAFRDGFFIHNNRFITLRLAAGPHTLGATYKKPPSPRETLKVNLEAGKTYVIRAQGETKGAPGIYTVTYGRLDLMSCAEARPELAKSMPLKVNAFRQVLLAQQATMYVDESSASVCK